ncbi:polysaccharide biosynthesis protein [Sporosarcina sp. HYO08]|uniref:putative polysaccharide biosynthesis protein n=1 Tax=Sporosarcina sp. HYO08 TaxID=1759557 RepID=UPI00079CC620|nr:polysaccharide biosynthesis protein [Sporosarcina sp. HYO08]KXH86822.1 hypothetical protein AU377_13970 [Sporosarcina sp. HYO08]
MTQQWNMKTFMKGASILTISAIVVKILSAVYRVPFQNLVGDKGFYIYQQVYPIIGIFVVWTSYGFSAAVSKVMASSSNRDEANAKMAIAFYVLTFVSLAVFIFLLVFAQFLANAMGDPELAPLIRVCAAIILMMPALGTLKGVFQSEGRMVPVAVSNVGEQAFRVIVILCGTWLAVRSSASLYKTGEVAIWGTVVGQAAGVIILVLYFRNRFKGEQGKVNRWAVVKDLAVISVSVSASALILLLFQLIDSFTVYKLLLASGYSSNDAMVLKGIYDRGQPLVQMGILVASTLALAIVPLISHQASKKQGRGAEPYIRLTFRTALLFGWAATIGLMLILPAANEMLFETKDGSEALMIFVMQIFWCSLLLPLTAILQGAGKVKVPILLFLAGMSCKVIANYLLVPHFSITGAAIAGNFGFVVIALGIIFYFKKIWALQLASRHFYRSVLVATALMSVVVLSWQLLADGFIFDNFPSRVGAMLIAMTSIAIGAITFLFMTMKLRVLAEREWYLLPFGKRLAIVQLKLHKKKR